MKRKLSRVLLNPSRKGDFYETASSPHSQHGRMREAIETFVMACGGVSTMLLPHICNGKHYVEAFVNDI